MITLEFILYAVIILAMILYAMLDGFDLGVGMLHPFIKGDMNRRIFLNSIGPVWDGNEMWLVIVVGSLFAGFPDVYATVLSSFYIPVMILLMGLMARAVSIEFRSKREGKSWRRNWDFVFSFGSYVIGFGVGIFLGNLIQGIPLDENHNMMGNAFQLISPYSVLVGLMTVSLFIMHGAIYLVMKTENELHDQMRRWVPKCIGLFLCLFVITTIYTIFAKPYMVAPMKAYPAFLLVPIAAIATILLVPYLMKKQSDGWAFLFSCFSIALLLSLAAIGTFPNFVISSVNPETNSLTFINASSSDLTLKILMIIIGIGLPLIFAYGYYVYRIFRGKVKIDPHSY